MLRAARGNELEPLKQFHFVVHEPHLISGNQITAGLALPALYYWMLKSFDVTSWAAFIDRYGYPIRIGKYGKKATEQDRATLRRAVAAIGQDFGVIIPESAIIDIIEAKHTSETSGVYKTMADWIDKEISKLVLGQTMTTDEGSSRAQSETHDKVRDDIADSDIQQVIETINAALTVPYINFNYGEQKNYPRIDLFKPDEKNVEQIINAIDKLGPQGLKVKSDEVRSLLGLSNPDKDDETIGGQPKYDLSTSGDEGGDPEKPELNAERNNTQDELDTLIEESGYVQISEDIAAVIEKAANTAADFESFREELAKLVTGWAPDKIAECIAVAAFKARVLGDAEFDKDRD
jgi:phage gp29-like protein